MGGRTIALVLAVALASAGRADEPDEPGLMPPLIVDPNVEPAQYTEPAGRPPGPSRAVADPPAPVVRIQVRVPADAAEGDNLKYVLHVQNTSAADAHAVTVRNRLPDNATFVRADPPPDDKPPPGQLVWSLKTLKAGQSKSIELVLKPNAGAKEVKNLAYVRFEHGEQVTTKIANPGLKVTKAAPKNAVRGEPFAVRVVVENTGRVPAEDVRVVEDVGLAGGPGVEVEPVTSGGRRTKNGPNQWEWDVGTLMPGRRQVIEYRLTPKEPGEVATTTQVPAAKGTPGEAKARTRVLVPGLSLKLTGPDGPVGPGEAAEFYEITVRNTGTLPSTNVRVAATFPPDLRLTKRTEGGQAGRDGVVWVVPRLEPEEARLFRFALKAGTAGQRTVTAAASDARQQRDAKEKKTLFRGTAALVWEQSFNRDTVSVGQQGVLTVRVRNNGGEDAGDVRVEVDLPDEVRFVQATPERRPDKKLVFPPETIGAGKEAVYTVTYQADRGGQAAFDLRLAAEALGDRPLTATKSVSITGGK